MIEKVKADTVKYLKNNGKSNSEDWVIASLCYVVLTYASNYFNIIYVSEVTLFKVLTFMILIAYLNLAGSKIGDSNE
jgi:hypothetical protein